MKPETKIARKQAKENARVEAEKAQKQVKEITFSIEWRKSRTWGANPHMECRVSFQDGTFEYREGFTCSGCGYDKESTVIAQAFNEFMKYKLYQKPIKDESAPYGIRTGISEWEGVKSEYRSFEGGVGTNCYYRIAEYIGGKFERTACGKTFDVYKYIDNQVN